jgi:hypothetical protein
MTKLEQINIKRNPLSEKSDYSRDKVFEILPSLMVVDSLNKKGEKVESSFIGGEDGEENEDYLDEEGEEFDDDEDDIEEDDEDEEDEDDD